MSPESLSAQLESFCKQGDEKALAHLAAELGFVQSSRSAANLLLLYPWAGSGANLAQLAQQALAAADPDQALNGLERLAGMLQPEDRQALFSSTQACWHVLIVLGASTFLTNILCRRPTLCRPLFVDGGLLKNKNTADMLDDLCRQSDRPRNFPALQKELRLYKQQEILRIAGRDLGGLAPLEEVTAELSDLAAACLQRAVDICGELLQTEHGAPLIDTPDGNPGIEAEFVVLAMGKFGGRELNFSSDIDLIYCYSSDQGQTTGTPDGKGGMKNRLRLHQYFVKLAELVTRAIGQRTEEGLVFRVDLDLRPEGKSGEVVNSLSNTEAYYEHWGQSWERCAMLKAKPIAGSLALGEQLLDYLEPFIYRRFLDYTMIEDLKLMKQKINRNLTREREGELNLKLGRGGIREIEFFIQAIQLVHSGKKPELRERNSLKALALLRREGLADEETYNTLSEAYIFLRTTEHRIQVEQERQTHNLPLNSHELSLLGRRCGFAEQGAFMAELERHRQGVEAIYHDLFYTGEEEAAIEVSREVRMLLDPALDEDLAKDLLEEKGFSLPDAAYTNLLTLRDGPPHVRLSPMGRRHLERIAPLLLQEVLDFPEPDMALRNLEHFLSGLHARATFYALLAENLQIPKLLISLFGTSQFLSRNLIQHPEILDMLVARAHAVERKDRDTMKQDLERLLQLAPDYEGQLNALRRFRNEEFLRIALNDLYGKMAPQEGPRQLTQVAEICLEKAVFIARRELLPRFGIPTCQNPDGSIGEAAFAVVGMGKLGGCELTYHSDLDIIFIFEGEGNTAAAPESDPERFRPRSNQEYFARLAQRIISILGLITGEGYVYQLDTRLRPSGHQGPLVTSLSAYRAYHATSSQLWERQALIKARVVVGPAPLAERIAACNHAIVYQSPLPADHKQEIYRLRQRMEQEIAREDGGRLNIKTGRGGLVDVEFLVQYLQLLHGDSCPALQTQNTLTALKVLHRQDLLNKTDYRLLASGYQFLRRLENRLRLVHDQSINAFTDDPAGLAKMARRLGYQQDRADRQLLTDYHNATENIRAIFDRYLAPEKMTSD
ncbi:glutamate--ammonia ligase adenylyltransferase [Syntrophotalea carbinolica DSM 2380]|uniref:Glutamate--ammonia ligase adenylyltransferase n=1 Tax=Syntrophotalea carbinolica (strain DSM 2380 / NBRC 103641 / GraBd1) TaxID=338963 RepID=Q3A2J7_SYNC1|nr:bifunctional [glutamate--ammonia ligase]-adenylyl-L-tyrosine phosphorylase/[glutamate--ammonia-ligase] adenylyltransferase [Syntrophotalea carbinolica]ABA89410.1 glutamate--ammonia ligase adenylyltransferase [Syntrophotalea carbinolica DSM 2380]